MRRRRRVLIAIGALFAIGLIAYLLMPLPAYIYLSASGIRSDTEYCEHQITERIRVRLAYVSYIEAMLATWGVDPNNWEDHPLSWDFMPHQGVRIPYFDYEITRDGGNIWEKFWTYENWENRYPSCERFGKLDANTFWTWAPNGFAVTHDGGLTWIERDFRPPRERWRDGEIQINTLRFYSNGTGTIIQGYGKLNFYTIDGGLTWQPDPNFATPTADLN